MKFICDDNLGKLASYLRILGFDTLFYEDIDDATLLRLAASQSRHLISRDHKLAVKTHAHGFSLLEIDDPLDQLTRIIDSLSLTINTDLLFSRCSKCNAVCEVVDKDALTEKVFPYILKTQKTIMGCPSCGRYYWRGTHYTRILGKLKEAIGKNRIIGIWPE